MLTVAAFGLAGYGIYSAGLGLAALAGAVPLDWWAGAALIGFGLLLVLSAPFVRVRFPGSLALAIGAMLALQALSLHNDYHFYGRIVPAFQAARGVFAGLLVLLVVVSQALPDPLPDEAPPRGGAAGLGDPDPPAEGTSGRDARAPEGNGRG